MAAFLGRARHQPGRPGRRGSTLLQPHDVSLPVRGRASCRQPVRLYRSGHQRPLPPTEGRGCLRADRFRCVRNPLGESRAEGRHPSDGAHPEEHRELRASAQACRPDVRLDEDRRHDGSGLLPVDAVALSTALQGRTGREEGGAGQLVPLLQDRSRQRAGRRRSVRALRHRRWFSGCSASGSFTSRSTPISCWTTWSGSTGPRPRRLPSGTGSGDPRGLASGSPSDRASGGSVGGCRTGTRDRGVHHPSRYGLRCHLPGAIAGAPGRRRRDDERPTGGRGGVSGGYGRTGSHRAP